MSLSEQTFDVAVSFAGAQRGLVEPVVRACQRHGLTVFYDADHTITFWGRNFITEMRTIYCGARARYVVPFLSEEYLASAYPMDEFSSAMPRAIEVDADPYLLPIVVGSVEVPPELLNPAIGYLRFEDYGADELGRVIADRVGAARRRDQEPREVVGVVDEAFGVRLPNIATRDFSPRTTLREALVTVGTRFRENEATLTRYGYRCSVEQSATAVEVLVDAGGQPVCGLRLAFTNDWGRDERLLMAFQWPRVAHNGSNGWVTAEWDPEGRRPALRFADFGVFNDQPLVTPEELFDRLWGKVIDHINSVGSH